MVRTRRDDRGVRCVIEGRCETGVKMVPVGVLQERILFHRLGEILVEVEDAYYIKVYRRYLEVKFLCETAAVAVGGRNDGPAVLGTVLVAEGSLDVRTGDGWAFEDTVRKAEELRDADVYAFRFETTV